MASHALPRRDCVSGHRPTPVCVGLFNPWQRPRRYSVLCGSLGKGGGISQGLWQSGYWRADKSFHQELLSQQFHVNGPIVRVVLIGSDSSNQQTPFMRGEIGNRKSMGHDALRCDRDAGVTDAVRLRQVPILRPKRCIPLSIMTRALILCHEGTRFRDRTCREPCHITPAALPR